MDDFLMEHTSRHISYIWGPQKLEQRTKQATSYYKATASPKVNCIIPAPLAAYTACSSWVFSWSEIITNTLKMTLVVLISLGVRVYGASLVAQMVKKGECACQLRRYMRWELEGMATHSSILAWRIPWTEETGRLQSTELHKVGHDWPHLHVCVYICVKHTCLC